MQPLGHNSPDWSLGFKNTLEYKGFDLSIYMYMRWGQMIKYSMLTNYDPTVAIRNFPAYFVNEIKRHQEKDYYIQFLDSVHEYFKYYMKRKLK